MKIASNTKIYTLTNILYDYFFSTITFPNIIIFNNITIYIYLV